MTSGLGRIVRDAAWLLAGRAVGQGLMVLFTVVLVGRLGLVGFGGYAYVAAVVFVANVVTTFGTDMVLIRDIAGGGAATRWSAALAVQLLLSALAMAAIWVAAPLGPGGSPVVAAALRLYSVSLVPAAVFSVCSAGLRGAGRMRSYAALGAAAAALQLGAAALLVPAGADLVVAASVLLAVQVVVAALAWTVCAARVPAFRYLPPIARADVAEMTRSSARIGVLGLLGVLYQRLGVLALAAFSGPVATGWFAGATRIVEASRAGHVALFGALYPAMVGGRAAGAGRRSPDGLRSAWRLTIAGGVVIGAALVLLGPAVTGVLYGPAFAPSAAALAILAVSVVPSTLATHRSLELVAAGREGQMVRALLASLAVLVALLALLVPVVGWLGAPWAILGAEVFQAGALLSVPRLSGAAAARSGQTRPVRVLGEGSRELPEPL